MENKTNNLIEFDIDFEEGHLVSKDFLNADQVIGGKKTFTSKLLTKDIYVGGYFEEESWIPAADGNVYVGGYIESEKDIYSDGKKVLTERYYPDLNTKDQDIIGAINELKQITDECVKLSGDQEIDGKKTLASKLVTRDLYVGGIYKDGNYIPDGCYTLQTSTATIKNNTYINTFSDLKGVGATYFISPSGGSNYLQKIEVEEFNQADYFTGKKIMDVGDLQIQEEGSGREELKIDESFTIIFGNKLKIEENSKTFSDGYKATKRINFGQAGEEDIYHSSLLVKPSVKVTSAAHHIRITIWWACGGDGRNYSLWVDTGKNKSRLEVSGTFVAHGETTMGSTEVKSLNVKNEAVFGGSVTMYKPLNTYSSISIDQGKLYVQGGISTGGTLDLLGNDIINAQSLNVLGTLKGEGDVFSDKFKPLTHDVGRVGYPTKRFDVGYINTLTLSNSHHDTSSEYYPVNYALYYSDPYWYQSDGTVLTVPSGYRYIRVPAGCTVGSEDLDSDTYFKVVLDESNRVIELKKRPQLDRVYIEAGWVNTSDRYKKNLLLNTPSGGGLYHNGSEVLTKDLSISNLKTVSKDIPGAINELKDAQADFVKINANQEINGYKTFSNRLITKDVYIGGKINGDDEWYDIEDEEAQLSVSGFTDLRGDLSGKNANFSGVVKINDSSVLTEGDIDKIAEAVIAKLKAETETPEDPESSEN